MPITLLVLGPGTIVPVRITELSIDITEFTPGLYPLMAKATVALQVLTPDVFKCTHTTASKIAVAAFKLTKLQDDALAIANVGNVGTAVASMLPL